MLKKPKKCCGMGSYEHQIYMPIRGRVRGVDFCISHIVAALNASGIETLASCCGHGHVFGHVALEDGKELFVIPDFNTSRKVEKCLEKAGLVKPNN